MIYDVYGSAVAAAYGVDGSSLLAVYDMDGNPITLTSVFQDYLDAIDPVSVAPASLVPCSADYGTLQYVGGICVNNKIYCTPNSADSILVYDIATGTTSMIGSGLGTRKFKYTGQIYYNGKIYMLHRGVNNMIEIDPTDDSYRLIALELNYQEFPYPAGDSNEYQNSYHYNGVVSNRGYLYQPPAYNNTDLLKINMRDFSVEKIPFTSPLVNTWIGCVKHPTEDKIIFLSTKVLRVWDCRTDTYTDVPYGATLGCYDMVYDPRFNCFIGVCKNHFLAVNLADYSIIVTPWVNYLDTGYGVSLGLDGRYYHIEGGGAFYATFDGQSFAVSSFSGQGNFGDATPYVAGQAIDTNGNIYGIPASGCMSKLSFSGVVKTLDPETVSSQYYGKY